MATGNLASIATNLSKVGRYRVLNDKGEFDGSKTTTLNSTNKTLRFDAGFRVAGTRDALGAFYKNNDIEAQQTFQANDLDDKELKIKSPVAKEADTTKFEMVDGYRNFDGNGELEITKDPLTVGMIKQVESNLAKGKKKAKTSDLGELIEYMQAYAEGVVKAKPTQKESKSPRKGTPAAINLYLNRAMGKGPKPLGPAEKKGFDVTNFSGSSPTIGTIEWKGENPRDRYHLGDLLGEKYNKFYFGIKSKNYECDGICGAANFVAAAQNKKGDKDIIDDTMSKLQFKVEKMESKKPKKAKSKITATTSGYIQEKFAAFPSKKAQSSNTSPKPPTVKKAAAEEEEEEEEQEQEQEQEYQ